MTKAEILALASRVEALNNPNQGMTYTGDTYGERRFDSITGEPYFTASRPATLTVYGDRAKTLLKIIENCEGVAAALRAKAEGME